MEDSRAEILSLLQRKPGLTVEELAQSLELAAGTVRRHLDILQRDRLVSCRTVRRELGRPVYVYFLTDEGQERLPKDYRRLSTQILRHLTEISSHRADPQSGVALLDSVFSGMSEEVLARYHDQLTDKAFAERISVLLSILEKEHFTPEAERTAEGVLVHLYNCPFRGTALENPSVCNYDCDIIAKVLQSPTSRRYSITQGDRRCSYFTPRRP